MKKFLMLLGAIILFCSCTVKNSSETELNSVDSNTIPLVNLSIYGNFEKYLNSEDEKIIFTLDKGFSNEMSVPIDLLIELVYSKNQSGKFSIIGSKNKSVVNEWNLYALEKISTGKKFDRKRERTEFLEEKFGSSSVFMEEYFRILERQIIACGALSGIGTPSTPGAEEICQNNFLKELNSILKKALLANDDPKVKSLIQNEQKILKKYQKLLTQTIRKNIRRAYANSGKKTTFSTLYGDQADLKTTLELMADKENLTIILIADEPADPAKKISKVQQRDYANMWAEDCFEIFLVPDKKSPQNGWQFIVNSRGSLWDARHSQQGQCDVKWSADNAKVEFAELGGAWQIKLIIPWKDLGFETMPKQEFLANIYRNRAVNGEARSSYAWSPIYAGAYYQVPKFGRFVFGGKKK